MNWDAIIAITEVIGLLVLIGSIAYLAIEVRQNNLIAKDAAFRDLFTLVGQHFNAVVSRENREAHLKGLVAYEKLSSEEKFVFDHNMAMYLILIEASLLSHDFDLLRDESLEDWAYYMRTRILPYPGALSWWKEAKNTFPPDVQTWVDMQVQQTDMQRDIWGIK